MTLTRETRQQMTFTPCVDGNAALDFHVQQRTTLHWPTGTLARELAEVSAVECEGCDRVIRVHGWDGEYDPRRDRIGAEIVEYGPPDASQLAYRVIYCQRCRDMGGIEGTMWCDGCNRQLDDENFVVYNGDYACTWCHETQTLKEGTPEIDEKYTTVPELEEWALDDEPPAEQWEIIGWRDSTDAAVTLAARLQARWGELLIVRGHTTRYDHNWGFYRRVQGSTY